MDQYFLVACYQFLSHLIVVVVNDAASYEVRLLELNGYFSQIQKKILMPN